MTENHGYETPEQGAKDWHIFLNRNFETIDTDIEVRDSNENRNEYTPKNGAKFFATDTGTTYIGDGEKWIQVIDSNIETVEGIGRRYDHIGALPDGEYHDNSFGDGRWSLHFWAQKGLSIHSALVDADLSNVSVERMTVELRKFHAEGDSTLLTEVEVSLSDGLQRIDLNLTMPEDGEYLLCRPSTNGEIVPLRRISNWTGWNDYTRTDIDLLGGVNATEVPNGDYTDYYYYFFDLAIGDETLEVESPWSPDVEEIYMRPRDPTEEYGDDVSPRALWIDTSE